MSGAAGRRQKRAKTTTSSRFGTKLAMGSRHPSIASRRANPGNPRGRPRNAKKKPPQGQGLDFGTQPANQMLLEEAYRTVSIREGDKVIELPVLKAVFRAMGVSAMKGNRLAQATMAELVRSIEEEDRQLRSSLIDVACGYKYEWEQAIEHARKHGLPEPTPLPHPDDVIIDVRRAEVRYEGPITPEEKKSWDELLNRRDEAQADVVSGNAVRDRATIVQRKTRRPVQFEILEPARSTLLTWLERRGGALEDFVFPIRVDHATHLSTRQYG